MSHSLIRYLEIRQKWPTVCSGSNTVLPTSARDKDLPTAGECHCVTTDCRVDSGPDWHHSSGSHTGENLEVPVSLSCRMGTVQPEQGFLYVT